ncbi:MAG: NADH-quinone oxidoreductase subunit L [Chloroflexi bacterium]|nr:NADH-quinone oxidoreductase subunit L [Chloroflexota bacterium]PKB57100.1 MAG: NADH-quinone oxidoreductase subunit L [SAR202 cluster bacterium Casp-Chloro-G3]
MEWAWLIPVFSFAAVPLIILFGKYLPGKGSPLAILAIAGGFALFCFVFIGWLGASPDTEGCSTSDYTGTLTCEYERTWFQAGLPGLSSDVDERIHLNWGILIDPLTLVMLGLITFVALMVQVYSLGYMHGDSRFSWYYAFHALFIAAMLTLALADNFLLLYVAWELVGLCSYLLIGFWFERPAAREAAKKAFIVTRIGDVGLLIGILLIWREVGSFSMTAAFEAVHSGVISQGMATVVALLLFAGAAGKSAQFPLHVWLPDAMEGPTPVSALIHAATMVAAGVYLVARVYPIFEASGDALMVVAVIGLITSLGAATIALVSTDLKRILAFSTISHLGLMMLSLGAFGYTAAIFHLLAHGFSKALLFLGAGSVMHSTDELDIRKMGGLRKVMPLTALLFSIGALSLGGIPILAGFWSKDEILVAVNDHLPPVFIVLTLLTAFLSALYMARAMFAVFFGELRPEHEHVHDAPPTMAITMFLLGILALGFGLISLDWPGPYDGIGTFLFFEEPEAFHFTVWLGVLSTVLAVIAFVLGYLIYARKTISIESIRGRLSWPVSLAENKYYIDELYQFVIDRVVLTLAAFIGFFDRAVVNDVAVNGPANLVRHLGVTLRLHVTGHVYSYALAMTLGAIVLALVWWMQSAS